MFFLLFWSAWEGNFKPFSKFGGDVFAEGDGYVYKTPIDWLVDRRTRIKNEDIPGYKEALDQLEAERRRIKDKYKSPPR